MGLLKVAAGADGGIRQNFSNGCSLQCSVNLATCGSKNKGKFCLECGSKKPEGVPQYRCDKCGWEPEDPEKLPKFCPECGDPFGDEDVK